LLEVGFQDGCDGIDRADAFQPVRELGILLVSRGPGSRQEFPRPTAVALLIGTQMGYPVAHDPN
jgi:hypothetical protein